MAKSTHTVQPKLDSSSGSAYKCDHQYVPDFPSLCLLICRMGNVPTSLGFEDCPKWFPDTYRRSVKCRASSISHTLLPSSSLGGAGVFPPLWLIVRQGELSGLLHPHPFILHLPCEQTEAWGVSAHWERMPVGLIISLYWLRDKAEADWFFWGRKSCMLV